MVPSLITSPSTSESRRTRSKPYSGSALSKARTQCSRTPRRSCDKRVAPGSMRRKVLRADELPLERHGARLAEHALPEVDDSRAEGAGLDELEIHPAFLLREV